MALSGKKLVLYLLFSLQIYCGYGQVKEEIDAANINIKESNLCRFITGIYKYTLTQTNHFNYADYFVSVAISDMKDSTGIHIEASYYPWEYCRRSKDSVEYYGYAVMDNMFFVFWNENKLIERKPGFTAAALFDNSIRIIYPGEKGLIFPKYISDPDVWSLELYKGEISSAYPDMFRRFLIQNSSAYTGVMISLN